MKGVDPAIIGQLIAAITGLLIALAGLIQSRINGRKADANAARLDENTRITKDVHDQTIEVKAIVANPAPQVAIIQSDLSAKQ